MKSVLVAINFVTSETQIKFFEGRDCYPRADKTWVAWKTKLDNNWTFRICNDFEAKAEIGRTKGLTDSENVV